MSTNTSSSSIAYQQAHYYDDQGPSVIAGCVVGIVFASLSVALRLWAQSMIGKVFSADSWFIVVAAMLAIASSSCTIAAVGHGLGQHELRVEETDPHPPERTAFIFEMGYVVTLFQAANLMFVKLAILVFYQRVFTGASRRLKVIMWIVFAYCLALGVGSTVEFILSCIPPQMFWLRVYPIMGYEPPEPIHGSCEPQTLHLVVPLILDLASEITLLIIPAVVLWNLQMPWRKKSGIIAAFSLGIFVTAISIARLVFAYQLEDAGDLSYDDTTTFLWTCIQSCFGVTTACIPAMAPLYRFAQTQGRSSSTSKYQFHHSFTRKDNSGRFPRFGKNMTGLESVFEMEEGSFTKLNDGGESSNRVTGGGDRRPISPYAPREIQVSRDIRIDIA